MQVLIFATLAATALAQNNSYLQQLKAFSAQGSGVPATCFTGLESVQTLDQVVAFCTTTLIPNFDATNPKNCFTVASATTATTVAPAPSASASSAPQKRDASSSSLGDNLAKDGVAQAVNAVCAQAALVQKVANSDPPTGTNAAYTGDSKAIADFVTSNKLNVDLATLVNSLVKASVSLKNGDVQNVPGASLTGGSSNGVLVQVAPTGFQTTFSGAAVLDTRVINNGTVGTGAVVFTLDATVKSFWLAFALSTDGTGLTLAVNSAKTTLVTYSFTLKSLRRRKRDAVVVILIGTAPITGGAPVASATATATSVSTVAASASTVAASASTVSASVSTVAASVSASAATGSSVSSSATSSTVATTTKTAPTVIATGATTTAATTTTTAAGGQTQTPVAGSTTTTTASINIKVGAANTVGVSVAAVVAAIALLL
ncbi:hypothetical protein BCR33DRAFT_717727 [Rhizoclosmatium globosum]|uniref:Uncharacterized protein n=1 Tax=Rhizoclosmatium globosum TaxID=329046 RepID=A0A1Y2C7K2_9FUNG|nr:hypothetical protein BCR33DRAFT_717727 [Rhizoclosmatium globosum]|eukprot:ORY43003.1 hypothetical protein BCR33DRAFT_717727 [Rhizoclosmatium globosum]